MERSSISPLYPRAGVRPLGSFHARKPREWSSPDRVGEPCPRRPPSRRPHSLWLHVFPAGRTVAQVHGRAARDASLLPPRGHARGRRMAPRAAHPQLREQAGGPWLVAVHVHWPPLPVCERVERVDESSGRALAGESRSPALDDDDGEEPVTRIAIAHGASAPRRPYSRPKGLNGTPAGGALGHCPILVGNGCAAALRRDGRIPGARVLPPGRGRRRGPRAPTARGSPRPARGATGVAARV